MGRHFASLICVLCLSCVVMAQEVRKEAEAIVYKGVERSQVWVDQQYDFWRDKLVRYEAGIISVQESRLIADFLSTKAAASRKDRAEACWVESAKAWAAYESAQEAVGKANAAEGKAKAGWQRERAEATTAKMREKAKSLGIIAARLEIVAAREAREVGFAANSQVRKFPFVVRGGDGIGKAFIMQGEKVHSGEVFVPDGWWTMWQCIRAVAEPDSKSAALYARVLQVIGPDELLVISMDPEQRPGSIVVHVRGIPTQNLAEGNEVRAPEEPQGCPVVIVEGTYTYVDPLGTKHQVRSCYVPKELAREDFLAVLRADYPLVIWEGRKSEPVK